MTAEGPHGPTSFEQVYDENFQAIFRYVLLRVRDVAEAQDLTSQTFLKALRSFWRLRWSPLGAGPWLYRIATNEVNSHFRRGGARKRWHVDLPPDGGLEALAAERESAEQQLQRQELLRDLARALRSLDVDDQTLVILRYFEKKRYSEIARILRKRRGTLAMRTHRALHKLRAELEKRGVDHEGVREGFARGASPRYSGPGVSASTAP